MRIKTCKVFTSKKTSGKTQNLTPMTVLQLKGLKLYLLALFTTKKIRDDESGAQVTEIQLREN